MNFMMSPTHESLSENLMIELDNTKDKHTKARKRELLLRQTTLLKPNKLPSLNDLKKIYTKACWQADLDHSHETYRTPYEKKLRARIKFESSYWIGSRNIDLFSYAIAGLTNSNGLRKLRGLAIEVDGKIHDCELKMRKDNAKYDLLHKLKIGLLVVPNESVHSTALYNTIQSIKSFPRLDTRSRRRLKRSIYLHTALYHLTDHDFYKLFNIKKFSSPRKTHNKSPHA